MLRLEGVEISTVTEFDPNLAIDLGNLRAEAFGKSKAEPADWGYLAAIVDSPDREQFVARQAGNLVGAATVNLLVQPWKVKTFLDFFMVSDDVRGQGVGHDLFTAVCDWGFARNAAHMNWTSGYDREAAHKFYTDHAAEIRGTAYFELPLLPSVPQTSGDIV